MHAVKIQRIQESFYIREQFFDRPRMVGSWVCRLPVSTHIAANHTVVSCSERHPVIPEARATTSARLDHNRLCRFPGIGEVTQFVMGLVVVGDDLWHVSLLLSIFDTLCYNYTKLISARRASNVGIRESAQLWHVHLRTIGNEIVDSLRAINSVRLYPRTLIAAG